MSRKRGDTAWFFWATLVLWSVSIAYEVTVNRRMELSPVVAGFSFFQSANWTFRTVFSRDPLFVNTAVSLLHSSVISLSGGIQCALQVLWSLHIDKLIIFITSLLYMVANRYVHHKLFMPVVLLILANQWMFDGLSKMLEHKQLFGGTWLGAYATLCFSCGYFAYDQMDMLRYRLYSGWFPSILAHHLVLLICFTLALYRHVTINYLILTLVCELHSIFLHIRKLRRMAGVRDAKSSIVKVEWMLNWASFLATRLICHILITYKLIIDASKFGKGIELPLALCGMAGMNLLNVSLGLDLLKAYKKEKIQ